MGQQLNSGTISNEVVEIQPSQEEFGSLYHSSSFSISRSMSRVRVLGNSS